MKAEKWQKLVKEFSCPGSFYRGAPFWAWNGKLEPEELQRQVRIMKQMGLGGFFMHSRVGLDTAYLSEDWFRCVRACVDQAEKSGMYAWLYDEDRWPSGAAGGLVTRQPRFRMRSLVMTITREIKNLKWTREVIAAFTGTVEGNSVKNLKRLSPGKRIRQLAQDESLLIFSVRLARPSPWFNGYTYLDILSPEAVREFIRVTYVAYQKRVGRFFGRSIPGIFTDEPHYGHMLGQWQEGEANLCVPWTDRLPVVFKKRYGYEIMEHLPEIFLDIQGQPVSKARYHYHECATFLFVDSFARQIGQWCGRNRLLFTGHVLGEDTLASQTAVVGDAMRFYQYMQAPGMDLLTERWRIFITAKQVSSVAHQLGRKWRLTETYGCTGWDFPFAGHKALGDWQLALGINLRCQHLAWYTMLGEAKRDYPAAISYQSPWWPLYPRVEDYFGRLISVLSRGEEVRDLLVIHPIESMWLRWRRGWENDKEVKEYDRLFSALTNWLLAHHLDFDYGNEEILARYGRVGKENGRIVLSVGRAAYSTVLVPPLLTIRRSTLELLKRFQAAGGKLVFLGQAAPYLEAEPSELPVQLASQCLLINQCGPELTEALNCSRRVSITDSTGRELTSVLYLLREDSDAFYLFLCNTGENFLTSPSERYNQVMVRERKIAYPEAIVRGLPGWPQPAVELDPETGQYFMARNRQSESGWEILTEFPALGSRLFVIPKKEAIPAKPAISWREIKRQPVGGDTWKVSLSEANVLVLDRPEYRLSAQEWQPGEEILRLDRIVREKLGLAARGGAMVQPWARKKNPRPRKLPVSLKYSFTAEYLPSGNLFLAIEKPELYRIKINGQEVSPDMDCGWWVDRSLKTLPIDPAILRPGSNQLLLECDYDENHPGLEVVYLLGNFGVRVENNQLLLCQPPETLKTGDWTEQGLYFYAGSVSYFATFKPSLDTGQRLFLHLPDYRGVAARVFVDGQLAGVVAWPPNEIEITALVAGKNEVTLTVEIVGHRRNSHGPFHLKEKWPAWTGPAQFVPEKDNWYDGYQVVPCGLLAPLEVIIRQPQ
ncbi:MAG TPA: glycosyl hydrolase [bacterium]|nr:glycosyl hydrolase [bacterium]